MTTDHLREEMTVLLERAEREGLTNAAEWIRRRYFGKEPPLANVLPWLTWYVRNHNSSADEAVNEWKRRNASATSPKTITPMAESQTGK